MAMGVVVVIPWTVAILFSIQDLEAVQASFLPSFEVFYQATGSKSAATALQAYLTFLYYSEFSLTWAASSCLLIAIAACIPSQWVTCSRITWAFARDVSKEFATSFGLESTTNRLAARTPVLELLAAY
jgi:choline transport protein